MRFRITIILMVALGGLTAVAVGTVLFVSASASVKNTLELMQARAELTISAVERGVADHVAPARNLVGDFSQRVANGSLNLRDRDQVAATLSGALAPAPQIGGVVVWNADRSGLWVFRNDDGGISVAAEATPASADIADFLSSMATASGTRWGAPYFFDGETFITIGAPLLRDGQYVGAIATGVSLVSLSRFALDLAPERSLPSSSTATTGFSRTRPCSMRATVSD